MDPHHRAKALFLEARELPEEERVAWLDEACGEDASLRAEIESLLAAEEGMTTDFLGHGVRPRLSPGSTVSRYRILKPLGSGGMGEVWLAEQREPVRRRVALKIVKWGLSSDEVLARFEAERQALALMVHPGIAQVYDAGTTPDGRPYFAMEYVSGIPITDYCDRCQLDLRRRLDLFRQVCLAVQHAHQKGVIHRDLKPGNVLVAEVDGEPQAKVIDFGVAKATSKRLTERTLYTELNVLIGTPEYMSPEQADPATIEVDSRSDIYSLGVILYKLLTDQLPFDDKRLREVGYEEMLRILREEEPPRLDRRLSTLGEEASTVAQARNTDPGTLVRALRGDLDWVVAKALRKEPERRYMTVAGLTADLDRYLGGRPVEARPDTITYRAGRFLTRHRIGATAAALLLALLVAYAVTATLQARALSRERDRAQAEAAKAQQVKSLVLRLFEGAAPQETRGEELSVRALLERGWTIIESELGGQPEVQVELLGTVGEIYRELGLYGRTESLLGRALKLGRTLSSHEPVLLANVLRSNGRLQRDLGDYGAADGLFQEALELYRHQFGDTHSEVAMTLYDLGWTTHHRGDYERAEAVFRQSLAMRRELFGDEHRDVAESLAGVGSALTSGGDYTGGERLSQQAVDLLRRLLPEGHPDLADHLFNLAVAQGRLGKLDSAEALYRETLALMIRIYGEDHVAVADVMDGLAQLLRRRGDPEGAESLLSQALTIRRRALGKGHLDVAANLNRLGQVLHDLGKLDAAESMYNETLNIYPPDHPWRSTTILNLGQLLQARGDHSAAESLYRQALAEYRAYYGEDDVHVAYGLNDLGGVLYLRGDFAAAESHLRQSIAILRQRLPHDHFRLAEALAPLGSVLFNSGRFAEAKTVLQEALEIRRVAFGETDPRTVEVANALDRVLASESQ